MSNKDVLIVKLSATASYAQLEKLNEYSEVLANRSGMTVLVAPHDIDLQVSRDSSDIVEAIRQQTEAITLLANSNAALVQAMADVDGMDDEERPVTSYLDGTPA